MPAKRQRTRRYGGLFEILPQCGIESAKAGAVQDDPGRPAARAYSGSVWIGFQMRAFGVDMRRRGRDGTSPIFQRTCVLRRIFQSLDRPAGAFERDAAVQHAVVGRAHRLAVHAAGGKPNGDEGPLALVRCDDSRDDAQRLVRPRSPMDQTRSCCACTRFGVRGLKPGRLAQRARRPIRSTPGTADAARRSLRRAPRCRP